MRVNKLTIAALAVVAGLSLTACQNDDVAAAGDTPAASPTAAGTGGQDGQKGNDASTGGSDGNDQAQGSVAGTGSNQNGEVGECRTDELEVTAVEGAGGDDEGLVAVEFGNEGGRDCSLVGYAGVDLKTNSGTVSAERTGEEAETVILKDGESVSFAVSYPINNSGGSGVKITSLVVTPPNETKSVTLDWPGSASLPVTDGSGSSVKVGPMGSAGQGG